MAINADDPSQPLSERLFAAGWRQGSMFSTRELAFASNRLQSDGQTTEVHHRNVKPRELLVVISQDCDIVSDDEPFVEVMICSTTNQERAHRLDRNSARWFVVDREQGLVAEARYRLAIEKSMLERYQPRAWPAGDLRFRRFVRWLGRRYDRPALPDALVDCLQKPLTSILEKFETSDPTMMKQFTAAVYEIRVTEPSTEVPPFDVSIYLMVAGSAITRTQARAISQVEDAISSGLDKELIRIGFISPILEEEMSVAEYFRTRPIFLEYLTYHGDEIDGAEPPPST